MTFVITSFVPVLLHVNLFLDVVALQDLSLKGRLLLIICLRLGSHKLVPPWKVPFTQTVVFLGFDDSNVFLILIKCIPFRFPSWRVQSGTQTLGVFCWSYHSQRECTLDWLPPRSWTHAGLWGFRRGLNHWVTNCSDCPWRIPQCSLSTKGRSWVWMSWEWG